MYTSSFIKVPEIQNLQENSTPYDIRGETQIRDSNFRKSLNNMEFKRAIIKFLSQHWEKNYFPTIINDNKIFLTAEESLFSYQVQEINIVKTEVQYLNCNN